MTDDDLERRLAMLEGRQQALIDLLLSHILASDAVVERLTDATRAYAVEQRDQHFEQRRGIAGLTLDDLLSQIDAIRYGAAND